MMILIHFTVKSNNNKKKNRKNEKFIIEKKIRAKEINR